MIIYNVRYTYQGESVSQHFPKKWMARERATELTNDDAARSVVIERDELMPVTADLVLRILNGEGYVIKRETIWTDKRTEQEATS